MRKILMTLAAGIVIAGSTLSVASPASAQTFHRWHGGGWHGGGGGWHGSGWHNHGWRGYGGGWHHHHDNALGAGIAGLAIGGLLGYGLAGGYGYGPSYEYYPAPVYQRTYPQPLYRVGNGHVAACEARYHSYDPRTDSYLGYDGYRHACIF